MFQVFIGIFIIFGLFEMITNTIYSLKPNVLELAVKQHREVPPRATQKQMKIKIKIMLLVGLIFFVSGILACINPSLARIPMLVVLVLFSLYTFLEAVYYKYVVSFALMGLAVSLLVIYILNIII